MAKEPFKCSKCDKSFSMAAHLGRHMSTIHASPQQKGAAKRKRAAKKAWKTRKNPRAAAKRIGRPKGIATGFNLSGMSIDQLAELITAARAEARRKLALLEQSWC